MKSFMDKLKKIPTSLSILIAGVLIAIAIFFVNNQGLTKGGLSATQAGDAAMKFINDTLLAQSTDKGTIKETVAAGEIYKVSFVLMDKEQTAYITRDGKILLPLAYEIKTEEAAATSPAVSKCEDVKKTDNALIEPYIVSNCPYGLQMQRVLAEIVKNAPASAANIKVRYIGSIENGKVVSMHGDDEAKENLKQICIREEQSAKYWSYVSCYMQKGDTAGCLTSTGIDQNKLNSCVVDANKGLKYAKVDFDLSTQNKIDSSPTMMLNETLIDESGFGGRTAEAVKTALCCGFSAKPSFCSKTLTTDAAAAGFSTTYKSSETGAANTAANCN